MKVRAPTPGEKHLPLEHQAVDPASALQVLVGVILLRVGHRAEQDRHAAQPCALNRALQMTHHVVLLDGRFGHLPGGSALGKEVVDRVDHQQGRPLRREGNSSLLLGQVGGARRRGLRS